jgi:hypothetical protein
MNGTQWIAVVTQTKGKKKAQNRQDSTRQSRSEQRVQFSIDNLHTGKNPRVDSANKESSQNESMRAGMLQQCKDCRMIVRVIINRVHHNNKDNRKYGRQKASSDMWGMPDGALTNNMLVYKM